MKAAFNLVLMMVFAFVPPAFALESTPGAADYITIGILAAPPPAGDTEPLLSGGIEITLAEGWHAYWRTPGEGGLPPHFDSGDSQNAGAMVFQWPLPQRIETQGLYSFGYKESVILPFTVPVPDPAAPVLLVLKADIMVCSDICVPQHVETRLEIPASADTDPSLVERLAAARARVPVADGALPGLKIENVVVGSDVLVATVYSRRGFDSADLFVEAGEAAMIVAPPEISIDTQESRRAMMRIPVPADAGNLARMPAGQTLILTLTDGSDAVEKKISF